MSLQTRDTDIYKFILAQQKMEYRDMHPPNSLTAFFTHIIFKGIVMVLFYFEEIFHELITELGTDELTILFVIVDFWFTKNINGRRLIGLRWFFAQDQHGSQRFMFQTRINQEEYHNPLTSKLFWIIQIVYLIIPIVDITTAIIIAPNIYRVSFGKVLVNLIVITGGMANIFLFYKAHSQASDKRTQFKRVYGSDFCRKLGPNSIVSYL